MANDVTTDLTNISADDSLEEARDDVLDYSVDRSPLSECNDSPYRVTNYRPPSIDPKREEQNHDMHEEEIR